MTKTALITGITGQDGAYLAEFLLNKGYIVHGIKRRTSLFNTDRIDHLFRDVHEEGVKFFLHHGDLTDSMSLTHVIQKVQPDEIYNLGAQSHVMVSFEEPEYTANSDATGALRILEAIRILGLEKKTRFYQASTSEMFGKVQETPQKETTPFYPRSPYGVAKLYAHWITINYRESYGIFACSGILFNHESPIRGETFVTRKITRALARIALGMQDCLYLGNLDSKRDWGHARDYVEAQWLMLQQDEPDDYVIATGKQYSVREFVTAAAREIGIEMQWEGTGANEIGVATGRATAARASTRLASHYTATPSRARGENRNGYTKPIKGTSLKPGTAIVRIDPKYFRPAEVETLLGDASKAKAKLGWTAKTDFATLVKEMMHADMESAQRDALISKHGYAAPERHE